MTSLSSTYPHLVLFICDDYSWHDCGCYGPIGGSRDVRTPRLDALAKQSLRFDQAIVASPTCTPSRSAMYTGLYPTRNGAHANHSLIGDKVKTLPQYLRELGYRVVIAGKTHFGPRESFPFEYLANSNIMPPGRHDVLWTDLNTAAVDELLSAHDRTMPLCLLVCAHSPHVYWPENSEFDPAKLNLPPNLVDTPQTRAAVGRYYADVAHLDRQVGEVLDSLDRHGYADKTLFAFTTDHGAQFPLAKWNLYDSGIRVPLIVRWPGLVKPGNSGALASTIDLLPTMIEAAGGVAPGDLDGRSLVNVLRGAMSAHHDAVFSTHTGDGHMNRSPARCIRTARYKFIHNLAPQTTFTSHISEGVAADGRDYWQSWVARASAGDATARRIVDRYRHRLPEELYDLSADPFEQMNLIDDPAFASVANDLRSQLSAWRIEQGENLHITLLPENARLGEIRYAG